MAPREFADDIGERQAGTAQDDQQMEHEVGGFTAQAVDVAGRGGERDLDAFLADFLRAARRCGGEQCRDVARRRVAIRARGDQCFEFVEPRVRARIAVEAAGVPRWQVGPAGSACASRESRSQSMAIETSASTWPELSPLRHRRCFERDQKWTSPVASVRSSALRSV